MADSILRLKVDSQEYDNKIRRAADGIQQYAQRCREAGGTLTQLDDGVLEFVQSLGKMDTVATTTKQQLREMSNALATLTTTYRELTDEEKQSPFGKELSKSIQQLTERAGKAKDAMVDVEQSIRNAASDTRMFDQLSQGASVMTAGFQGLTGAGKLLGIEMGNDVEVIAKLQSAMAVTNSLTTIQTALQKQSALMQGVQAAQTKIAALAQRLFAAATNDATKAQVAFNAVSKVNPYVMLASAVTAVGVALFAFTDNAKKATNATEEETEAMKQAAHMADIWKNTMGSTYSSLMTKYDELKRQWQSLSSEHSKTDWIKKNKTALHDLGGAVSDVKSAEDFFNNNTDAVVQSFVRRAQAAARVAQLTELYRKQIELLDKKSQASAAITADAQNSGRSAKAGDIIDDKTYRSSKYGKVNAQGNWVFTEQGAKLYSGTDTSSASSVMKIDVEIEANQSEIEKVKNQITNEFKDISVVGGENGPKGGTTDKNLDAEQKVQQKINDLLKEALTADANRQGEIRQQVAELQKQQEKYKDIKNLAQGILPKDKEAVFTIDGQLSEETKKALSDIKGVTIDSKSFTVTADTSDALKALQGIEGVTIDPKTFTITATDEALPQLREIENVTIDDKTMTVTADTQEAMQKVQELIGQVSTTTLQMKVAPPDLDKLFTDMSKENYNTGYAGSAQAKYDSARVDLAVGPMNLDAINTYISSIKGVLKDANLGDELYTSMTEKLKDATTVSTLLQEMMERGLAGADLESTAQALKEKLLSPEGIDQTAIQSFLDELNKQIEEAGGVGLKLNADTGEVTDDKDKSKDDGKDLKKFNEGIGKLSGGLSQVTGGLKAVGVEIPEEVDQVIGVINGVSQIISGVGTIISAFQTSAIVANTVALGALTAAVTANTFAKFIPFFSGGGVVPAFAQGGTIPKFADGGLIGRAALGMMIPGNSMSGDLLRMPVDGGRGMIGVNSGEVILNRAQQGVLANALQDSSMPNMKLEAVVSGEQILLATNNRGRRTGRGEIVQSRRMR